MRTLRPEVNCAIIKICRQDGASLRQSGLRRGHKRRAQLKDLKVRASNAGMLASFPRRLFLPPCDLALDEARLTCFPDGASRLAHRMMGLTNADPACKHQYIAN